MADIELNLVIDKSALQSLNHEECFWLHHFTRSVLTPILHIEILGNLKKDWEGDRSPEAFFAGMAKKARGHFSNTSLPSDFLMREELLGYHVEMQGRPIVGGAQEVRDSKGRLGVLVPEGIEQEDLRRWSAGDFSVEEQKLASAWRATLVHLEAVKGKAQRRPDGIRSLDDVAEAVDCFLSGPGNQWQVLSIIMRLAGLNEKEKRHAKARWTSLGRPMSQTFSPYGHFVLRCTLMRELGEEAQFLPKRATNVVDLLYLHYLPFCQLFISGDNVHTRLAPHLVRRDQAFLTSSELKLSLKELQTYFNSKSEAERSRGAARYARFMPLDIETPLHMAFDRVVPSWRKKALKPPPPMSKEKEAELLAELRPMMEAMGRALGGTKG